MVRSIGPVWAKIANEAVKRLKPNFSGPRDVRYILSSFLPVAEETYHKVEPFDEFFCVLELQYLKIT